MNGDHNFGNMNNIAKNILNTNGNLMMYHGQNCLYENDVEG